MIRVTGLSYSYASNRKITFADLAVRQGDSCLLLGESGSGKTTLLHLLGGLLASQEGTIDINGTLINELSESGRDQFRGRHIGFVFQRNHLINAVSVRNNLLMAPFLAGLPQDEKRVDEVLRLLDLADRKNDRVTALSQGQAQRVAIARAILNKPSVILADEPTSALDDKNCRRVMELLLQASAESNAALVIATHDQRLTSTITNRIQL